MKEVKGSYLLWGTIAVYLLYLFLNFMGLNLIKLSIVGIILASAIFILIVLVYSQLSIPFMYAANYEYDKINYRPDLTYKTYYLQDICDKKISKFIRFSLVYWIVVIVIEINTFCNKYFTFKL